MPLGSATKPQTSPYRGYVATYESVDGKVQIVVLGTPDVIVGECASMSDVQTAFEALVDDYLTPLPDPQK